MQCAVVESQTNQTDWKLCFQQGYARLWRRMTTGGSSLLDVCGHSGVGLGWNSDIKFINI